MITYETHSLVCSIGLHHNLTFPIHLHQELELLYVTKGTLNIIINNIEYTASAGHYVLIMPNTLHSYPSSTFEEHIGLIFSPNLIPHYKSLLNKRCTFPVIAHTKVHPDALNALYSLLDHSHTNNKGILKGYLYTLFAHLATQTHFDVASKDSRNNLIYEALTYINEHFRQDITAVTLAKHLGISTFALSKIFSQNLGYNFSYYLNMTRIDYAKYLLLETDHNITDICFECGFNTIRNFNRIFKEFTSLTPKVFRSSS